MGLTNLNRKNRGEYTNPLSKKEISDCKKSDENITKKQGAFIIDVKKWIASTPGVEVLINIRGHIAECQDNYGNFVCFLPENFQELGLADIENIVFGQFE